MVFYVLRFFTFFHKFYILILRKIILRFFCLRLCLRKIILRFLRLRLRLRFQSYFTFL